jgi:hypothetical protein
VDALITKNYSRSNANKEHADSRTREDVREEPIKVEIALCILLPYYDDEAPRLGNLILGNVKVAAICYNINDRESLENAIHKVCVSPIQQFYGSTDDLAILVVSQDTTLSSIHTRTSGRMSVGSKRLE